MVECGEHRLFNTKKYQQQHRESIDKYNFFCQGSDFSIKLKNFFQQKNNLQRQDNARKKLASHRESAKTLIDAPKWTSSNSSQCRGEKASIEFHYFGTPEQDEMARKHACQESIISLGTSFPVCINGFWTIN